MDPFLTEVEKLATIKADKVLPLYRDMLRIRGFEGKATKLYEQGVLPGFLHSSVGQEAVPVGVSAHLDKDDYITSNHRGHGHVLAKGMEPERMFAELYARTTGYNSGRGGSMHIMDFSLGIVGANGIVGAGVPIATGAGISFQVNGTKQVAVSYFGDGAVNSGAFHEGLNLAAIWSLPVVFVCENNFYAESVPQSYAAKVGIAERAAAYGIPGVRVDGNDLFAVYDAAKAAVARARKGEGPTLIECQTFRWSGHFVGDPGVYRTKEEVEAWRLKDPLPRVHSWLEQHGVTAADLDTMEAAVADEMDRAAERGAAGPRPDPQAATDNVYAPEGVARA